MIHHRTWFPLIVVGLTVLLAGVIISLFKDEALTPSQESAVTSVEYQANVHAITGSLRDEISAASNDELRAALLEEKRSALIELLVPSEYKDLHLELVIVLSQMIDGYKGDEAKLATAWSSWEALVAQYPWIE